MALGRNKTSKPRTPLAEHPAFAAILGLWVAALFGLAVMVVPAALLERVVEVSGVADVMPAAAAPLGSTARFLIAGAAAIGGGIVGFIIARVLAKLSAQSSQVDEETGESLAEKKTAEEPFLEEGHEVQVEDDPFPFDVADLDDEIGEREDEDGFTEHREPAILTIEELDGVGLDRAVAKDDALDWDFEEATHDPEDFNPDVGGWGTEDSGMEHEVSSHDEANTAAQSLASAPAHGLDILRQRSLKELSLAEMVERFGGALAEHREAIERNPALQQEVQPVITAALKALTGHEQARRSSISGGSAIQGNAALDISTREQAEATEDALREALEKLQRMSGNF